MLKNMRLGLKMIIGFGVLLAIAALLGALAMFNMLEIKTLFRKLAEESVPELEIANRIERASSQMVYQMRGYVYTRESRYLEAAEANLRDLRSHLKSAKDLALKYPDLTNLLEGVDKATAKVDEYEALTQETISKNEIVAEDHRNLLEAADAYMKRCYDFLDLQNAALKGESGASRIARLNKISMAKELIHFGDQIQIETYRAQAMVDSKIAMQAMSNFYKIQKQVKELTPLVREREHTRLLNEVLNSANSYNEALSRFIRSWFNIPYIDTVHNEVVNEVLSIAIGTSQRVMDQTVEKAQKTSIRLSFAVLIMIGGLVIAMVVGAFLAIVITRSISVPVRKGVDFARQISQGDLTANLGIRQKDEIGELAEVLNYMSENLRSMALRVQESAEQVASSSEEISASAQNLADGAQIQASTLEETSAAVEELAASVEYVANHAQSQRKAVEERADSMVKLENSVDHVSDTLDQVSGSSDEAVNKAMEGAEFMKEMISAIRSISESSEKITMIVNMISDIADQTNLLALNASIEAARAGEHGRGFAVVADEVSKLAERSATSTKEIEELIKESERLIKTGVEIAENSGKVIEEIRGGSQKSSDMVKSLRIAINEQIGIIQELGKSFEEINEMSQSISGSTEEQKTNARQVSMAIERLNEQTQQSASSAEEMSASTEELSSMAQELQSLMAQFKLSSDFEEGTKLLTSPERTEAAQEEDEDEDEDEESRVHRTVEYEFQDEDTLDEEETDAPSSQE